MDRTFTNTPYGPQVTISNLSSDERVAIERAIQSLHDSTEHSVEGIANLVRQDLEAGCLTINTIERLSKWANTGGSFASAVNPARKVARLLLGCPLVRLVDKENNRVNNYLELVEALGRQIK